jgi:hypothetical protein
MIFTPRHHSAAALGTECLKCAKMPKIEKVIYLAPRMLGQIQIVST